ncbi:Sua5/YciO/YrdC/YwlC family protein [Candidatus Peregrinibacteria bacterium]|nr:MAG: Sua5/YciO/YrdC/YwlC family protein [Candidatus Peregrinibacteria bacterium]
MLPVTQLPHLEAYAEMDDFARMVSERLLPGPVTLLLPRGAKIPTFYFPDTPVIGIRVPMHQLSQDLLTYFNGPLITTSANLTGQPIYFHHEAVMDHFADHAYQPEWVLEGTCDEHQKASTVLKVLKDSVQIYREGPLGKHELEAILGCEVSE